MPANPPGPGPVSDVVPGIPSIDMITATSKLQLEAADVRANKPNWKSYLQSQMIPQEDFNFVTAYEGAKSRAERSELLEKQKSQCARTFINLISNVAKDQNVRYVLTLLDDMLQEDRSRVEIFFSFARKQKRSVWAPFLTMLQRQDGFIVNQMSSVVAKLACSGSQLMDGSDLNYYFAFLKDQLKTPNNEYINTTARCLQMMLRLDEYRHAFLQIEGVTSIVSALNGKTNFQLQYQLAFCIWCMTFNPSIAERLHRFGVIQTLGDILSESTKEKVIRIILATFRNMIEKVDDREIVRDDALQMVQCKVLKTLELMDNKKFDDAELQEDIEFLTEKLQLSVQDLSSFDEYCTEIRSGRLQWSPVHKSEKFWRENVQKFGEKNHELVKILIKILEVAQDPLVLCVAAHDIGEYVRHYPRGKNVIEQFQGKQAVMKLLTADDPNVRYHALLAVQKLMVHNWEYLGKQLDADAPADQKESH
uniref:V-type proton ATPase subunit H n=1 Tax=Plectus sambesii TaxID=2011161 RepID=A0A914V7N8_9BILA